MMTAKSHSVIWNSQATGTWGREAAAGPARRKMPGRARVTGPRERGNGVGIGLPSGPGPEPVAFPILTTTPLNPLTGV